jgi:DNA-binding NtrC family response regulator
LIRPSKPAKPEATETLDSTGTGRPRASPRTPRVLVVASPRAELIGHSVKLQREQPLVLGRGSELDGLALEDGSASREHARLQLTAAGLELVDLQSKNGTFVGGERIGSVRLREGELFQLGRTFFHFGFAESLEPFRGLGDWVGAGEATRRVCTTIVRAAGHGRPVLLEGPTGAGKEVAARELHRASRRPGPFIAVNCATLSRELAAAELFGHPRGAFTGAERSTPGLFGAAHGGTLFLDEMGTLPLELQPQLLRALQEGKIRRVGEESERDVDVRVVAASNVSLAGLSRVGEFRDDLRARLSASRIELPGLDERREDMAMLVEALLRRTGRPETGVTPRLLWALLASRWPLNVRGLQNVVLAGVDALPGDKPLDLTPQLEEALRDQQGEESEDPRHAAARGRPEKDELIARLRESNGNLRELAKALGVHRTQLYRWLAQHELDPKAYRS